ncbi:MAG: MoaD/ThiS family protein [Candidatus Heimdallarchaeota archaeon]|nr:MoaD/ThiS family protein [Candidatus Heimdallarchaeota archaeon]MDH5646646.1 MoaD/ThiS family protein [Candidatus Heimdallarchaeota archaeon]
MAIVRLIGYFSSIAGYSEKEFIIDQPIKVRDIVNFPNIPEERIIVLINEKGANLDSIINSTDYVKIFPVIGGG